MKKRDTQWKCDIYRINMERKSEIDKQSERRMELKKHVAVIHSSNKLSLLQRKIANALLFHAYPYLQERDEHSIQIAKLCKLIGYDSNDHKLIKKALVNLLSTVLEWNLVDGERLDKEGVWNASSIIADASIDGSICTYSYSNKMKKLLYRPNMYGRLDMHVQAKFQSSYGLALYENCNRFQDIGQTPWFALDKFRKLMGVDESKYKIFRDFKTRVLDKAVEEVNKNSHLVIKPQLRKQNRKVIAIQFSIKTQIVQLGDDVKTKASHQQSTLSEILKTNYGFSGKQISQITTAYAEGYIREKINLIETSISFRNGKIKNLAKYLLSALQDDYQLPKKTAQLINSVESEVKKNRVNNINDNEKKMQFRRYQDNELFKSFNGLSDKPRTKLLKKFEKFLTGMYQIIYNKDGLKNILVQDQLCEFLRQIKHPLINKLPGYEIWEEKFKNILNSDCSGF